MTLDKLLVDFYRANGIPDDGGIDDDTFEINIFGIQLTMPNPQFRKDALHIHDIQHILNDCDTSWKGEGFICGWEIATGMWKYFLLGILSLWAMGYVMWMHPKSVLEGYKKGLSDRGVIDLKISKADLMRMKLEDLKSLVQKEKPTKMGISQWLQFIFWVLVSEVIFLFPLLLIGLGIYSLNILI
ncbi:hypothetical protein [Flammeovirga sp. SJP92]|uniref:hypothetical protein n=1 Tax=Flammeovirga sp. SJP92 TaxID=1775430 RepID=UPI000788C8C5|nr:hypothetical protein [Flammeovirga sp. SJP92]KXX71831.1 hypothetical protein AVL50_03335 [Flammeovirga sp. SJP92]